MCSKNIEVDTIHNNSSTAIADPTRGNMPSITSAVDYQQLPPDFRSWPARESLAYAMRHKFLIAAVDVENYMNRLPSSWHPKKEEFIIDAQPEVGFSVFDPFSITDENPYDAVSCILTSRARHVRIRELAHLTNPRVDRYNVCEHGCEEHFQFGATEFASLDATKQILREHLLVPADDAAAHGADRRLRPIALLAHDARGDEAWLKNFGVDLAADPAFAHVAIVDTQDVRGRELDFFSGERTARVGLARVLRETGIANDHHHNSGNDAFRTLAYGLVEGCCLLWKQDVAQAQRDAEAASEEESQTQDTEALDREQRSAQAPECDAGGDESLLACLCAGLCRCCQARRPAASSSTSAPSRPPATTTLIPHQAPSSMTPGEAVERVRAAARGVHQFPGAATRGNALYCTRCGEDGDHLCSACGVTAALPTCGRCGEVDVHLTAQCLRMHVRDCPGTQNSRCLQGCHPRPPPRVDPRLELELLQIDEW